MAGQIQVLCDTLLHPKSHGEVLLQSKEGPPCQLASNAGCSNVLEVEDNEGQCVLVLQEKCVMALRMEARESSIVLHSAEDREQCDALPV